MNSHLGFRAHVLAAVVLGAFLGAPAARAQCGTSTPYFADRLFDAYFTPRDGRTDGATYRFYRLGDYYGVAYLRRPTGTIRVRGAAPAYIFDVRDLRYKGEIYD